MPKTKENFERWKVPEGSKLTGVRNHCLKQPKENQLVVTEKYGKPNQKLTETVWAELFKAGLR